MRTRSIAAEVKWRRIIGEQSSSGQTVAEFCRQRGLTDSSFFIWRRRLKLREGAGAQGASAFVEARLLGGDDAGGEPQPGIEIHLRETGRSPRKRNANGCIGRDTFQRPFPAVSGVFPDVDEVTIQMFPNGSPCIVSAPILLHNP